MRFLVHAARDTIPHKRRLKLTGNHQRLVSKQKIANFIALTATKNDDKKLAQNSNNDSGVYSSHGSLRQGFVIRCTETCSCIPPSDRGEAVDLHIRILSALDIKKSRWVFVNERIQKNP